jgi:homospermidine synthase
MDLTAPSTCLNHAGKEIPYEGFIISHGEASTIAKFLESENGKYRPSVYYCYKPCPIAMESLEKLRDNGYHYFKNPYVLKLPDITNNGYDSVFVKLYFKNGTTYFAGTSVDVKQAKKKGFVLSTPTMSQVAGSVNAALKYIIANRQKGLLEPEDLPEDIILASAMPYYGSVFFKWGSGK